MRKTDYILAVFFVCISVLSSAQNTAITDDDGYTADPTAMLDVKSTSKGMLVPRMTTIQRNTIVTPATGLLVYDTNVNGFYYYNGSSWTQISSGQLWSNTAGNVFLPNTNFKVGIGTINPTGKMEIKGDASIGLNEPLFCVVNDNGDTVFAVYNEGVRIWVNDDGGSKASGSRGGFAVGGYSPSKGIITNEYLRVTPDSVRIYINDDYIAAKETGSRGGFAVGGYSPSKGLNTDNYLFVQDDSTRVFVSDSTSGFEVANIQSGNNQRLMKLTAMNYFIGHQCGEANLSGKYNVFLGYKSGAMNFAGDDNIFIGFKSGTSNLNGHRNVFVGKDSGKLNSYGSENIFIGYNSGYNNLQGERNIFLGYRSGFSNVGGFGNEGSFNTFLGVESGFANDVGESNTFIGYQAGYSNLNGIHNTYIGRWSGQNNNGDYNVYIGTEAGRYTTNSSYRLHIEAVNGLSYIAPLIYGEFDTRRVVIDGDESDIPGGYPNLKFVVTGNAYANNWFIPSDKNLKTNIHEIQNPLEKVMKMNGVFYEWKDKEKYNTGNQLGFIAQDLYKILPEVVNPGEIYSINYAPITALLVEAIKQQQNMIDDLKKENENLKSEVKNIKILQSQIDIINESLNINAKK
ncbi:MAG: tail fiber domain-containing protein [Bacteroidota bacterium]